MTLLAGAALFIAVASGGPPGQARSGCDPRLNVRELSGRAAHAGSLAPGDSICFSLPLARGELARIRISVERGYVRARILSPLGDELQRTWTSALAFAAPSPLLTLEAPAAGRYLVELTVPAWVNFSNAQSFRIQVASREDSAVRARRRAELSRDPRVAWLRSNAQRLRTLDPAGDDFADLRFLHDVLRDARVVFLGEGDNGGGSDVLMKTRLVKFLHQRMGFDVLVFQTNMHSARRARMALDSGMSSRAAFELAAPRLLSRAEQGQPLQEYVAATRRGDRPLELSGFDSQFTGAVAGILLPDLRAFLRRVMPTSSLLDSTALPSRILAAVLGGQFSGASLPTSSEQAAAVEAFRAEARRLADRARDSESLFWTQLLWSTAGQLNLVLNGARGASPTETMGALIPQLAENLLWLLNTRYPERRVIIWTHTLHALRTHDATSEAKAIGYTVAEAVAQALGPRSFSIGLTSYAGTSYFITQPEEYHQSVIPNQHPGDGFETLMAAAGHDLAFVNLRRAREQGQWLGRAFVSNALYLVPEEADWSRALDALLFIHTQEPRRRMR